MYLFGILTGMQHTLDKKKFSLIRKTKGIKHALRGILIFIQNTHSAWIEIAVVLVIAAMGVYFDISRLDWTLLALVSGALFAAEAFNTAIEIDIDLTSPTFHPYARDTKDVAAGAVLITALTMLVVTILIFLPYF